MTRVKSLPVAATARVLGILCFLIGAVSTCAGLILMVVWPPDSPIVTLTTLLSAPFAGGLAGFCGAALACWFYNQLAAWMGGIRLELEEEAIATQAGSEEAGFLRPPETEGARARPEGREPPGAAALRVCRIKPNPAGKGRALQFAMTLDRPTGEWVDVSNHGPKLLTTRGVSLYHVVDAGPSGGPEYRFVAKLPDCSLKPNEVLRVHSGRRRELSLLPSEDRAGADWHTFTGDTGLVWNTREGDTAMLYEASSREIIDSTSYDPNPPEGAVLQRQGAKLVAVSVAAATGRR